MKRLLVFLGLGCGLGCGATQGDGPEISPAETPAVTTTDPVPEVDAGAAKLATAIERRLFPQKFSSTSHLENDWNTFQENYLAAYLGDDNPKTSWTEGKDDVGLGERVMVDLTPLVDASEVRLEIRNGYQKSNELFARNARAKDIVVKLLPTGQESKHTLTDSEGWQSIRIKQPEGPLHGYEISFVSVYPGSKYEDLVVSDIQTYVTARTPDNPGFETNKQERLLAWIAERKLAAQTFKNAAKGSMPVAATYTMKSLGNANEECDHDCPLPFQKASKSWGAGKPLFGALEAAAQEKFQGWKHIRLSATDKRTIPQADNFRFPRSSWGDILIYEGDSAAIVMPTPKKMAYLNAKNLKRVYVEKNAVRAEAAIKGSAPGCKREGADTTLFFTPDSDGPLRTLLIATCGLYDDREGYTEEKYWQVVQYADNGNMNYLFDFFSASQYSWKKKSGAAFLDSVTRLSTAGASDTHFTAK